MIINIGEKIHVVHRQNFDGDARRHFVGLVDYCEGALVRARGFLYAIDPKTNEFVRRDTVRTRIISLDSPGVIVNILPEETQIESIIYTHVLAGDTIMTDCSGWHMDITHL